VIINGSTALRSENLPFGGVKLTGGAREGLHDTLRDIDPGEDDRGDGRVG